LNYNKWHFVDSTSHLDNDESQSDTSEGGGEAGDNEDGAHGTSTSKEQNSSTTTIATGPVTHAVTDNSTAPANPTVPSAPNNATLPPLNVVAPCTDGTMVVAPRTDGPMVVAPHTDGPVVVAPRTNGPMVVAPRTYGPLVVATRPIKASNRKGTTTPQGSMPPGFRRLGIDLQLVPRPAAHPVDPQIAHNAMPPPNTPLPNTPSQSQTLPSYDPPLPLSSPENWSNNGSQENEQLEHEQLPDRNMDLANGNYTFNSSCSIVPDNCASVADTAVTSNAIASSNIIGQPNNDATDTPPAVVPHKKGRRPAKGKGSALQQPNIGRTTRGAAAASKKRTAIEAGLDETGDGVNANLTAPAKRPTRRTNQGAL
jgi:hypothetical protein